MGGSTANGMEIGVDYLSTRARTAVAALTSAAAAPR
jgi:hypothetical protein